MEHVSSCKGSYKVHDDGDDEARQNESSEPFKKAQKKTVITKMLKRTKK